MTCVKTGMCELIQINYATRGNRHGSDWNVH